MILTYILSLKGKKTFLDPEQQDKNDYDPDQMSRNPDPEKISSLRQTWDSKQQIQDPGHR